MGIGFYRCSEDVDAPILSQQDQGSFVRLLKTVLVDGYGTGDDHKPALGWELYEANSEIHTEINEMVLKNVQGSGHYLLIDGSGGRDGNATYKLLKTYIRAAESVESYDSGIGLSPPLTVWPGPHFTSGITDVYAGTIRWKIFGNARSFWVVCQRQALQYPTTPYLGESWHPCFYGDYDSQYVANPFNFITVQHGALVGTTTSPMESLQSSATCGSYTLRNVHQIPGGSHSPLWSGSIDGGQSYAWYTGKGPYGNQDNVYAMMRMSIENGGYIMGHLPCIRLLQSRYFHDVAPSKTVEYSDYKLHYLFMSRASSSASGFLVFIEGKGYDDAV